MIDNKTNYNKQADESGTDSKRADSKRTKSISRRINRWHVLELLSSFILVDVLIVVITVSTWCVSTEVSGGNDFHWSADKGFESVTNLELNNNKNPRNYEAYRDYKAAGNTGFKGVIFFQSLNDGLSKAMYVYVDSNGHTNRVYAGDFLLNIFFCLFLLMIVEVIILIGNIITGARKIRKSLAPLDELAFKAQVLSNTAYFDQQAFDELENAISKISPANEGARLHTGNAEMEHLENSINNLLERMRDNYKQQSRFVSDASHELRTPISVLQGYVNMLDRWGKEDENILDESIVAIKSETEHMKKLVEQLLFLARGDSGKTKLTLEEFSLNEMMKEVYEESSMIDKEHTYFFKPYEEDIVINGDISMLKQTARILIDNAAKYTADSSSIIIKTDMVTDGAANIPADNMTAAKISAAKVPAFIIQDEGIGIAGDDVNHMFERFFRSDPARTKEAGGTGLGLSIAKWIVDRHNGYFDVLSREEIGTRITVCLPQQPQS